MLFRSGKDSLAVTDTGGHGFFEQNMFAVLQCGDCDVRMQMGRDNDVNDIDIGLSDQLPIVRADRDVGAGSSSGCL